MEILITLILIVFGILQIILFFKIWGMTNDIREIKNRYISQKYAPIETEYSNKYKGNIELHESKNKFKTGDLVVIKKNEDQIRIGEIEEIDGVFYL